MLTLDAVTKSFGGRPVLDRLDLSIGAGESVALIGANGSGKTTMLRCVVGLARPDAGRITIEGFDVVRDPIRARQRISYLPQRPLFPPTLTVRETLAVVARLRHATGADVDREIDACALGPVADRSVVRLSGGERQRLGMAVALLPAADLYLFDEPSANLDPASSRILFQRARQLQRDGRALLFTTHIPADVRHLATRVVLLHNGRIDSEAAGEFELRRYERMLERFMWGNDHDTPMRPSGAHDGPDADDRLRPQAAVTGAGAGRSR